MVRPQIWFWEAFYPADSSDFHQRSLELSQNSSRTRFRRYENHSGPWKTILLKRDQNRSDLVRTAQESNSRVQVECKLDHNSRMVCVGSTPWFSAASDLSESTQLAQFIPKPNRSPGLDGRPRNTFCLISNQHFHPNPPQVPKKWNVLNHVNLGCTGPLREYSTGSVYSQTLQISWTRCQTA